MDALFTTENIVALVTLFVLEIILGIDNVIFITILADKLPEEEQARARQLGIGLAVVSRIILLFGIGIIIQLQDPIFTIAGHSFSGRDLILLIGGMFLIGKSTYEIHEKLEGDEDDHAAVQTTATLGSILVQIILLDVVFSLDSVITAVGITETIPVIVIAIVGSAIVMILFAGAIAAFVKRHPSMKMLALSFLILIGALLVIEGWDHAAAESLHLKNYIYFAIAFSFLVELLNIRLRQVKSKPVDLRHPQIPDDPERLSGKPASKAH